MFISCKQNFVYLGGTEMLPLKKLVHPFKLLPSVDQKEKSILNIFFLYCEAIGSLFNRENK